MFWRKKVSPPALQPITNPAPPKKSTFSRKKDFEWKSRDMPENDFKTELAMMEIMLDLRDEMKATNAKLDSLCKHLREVFGVVKDEDV